MAQSIVPQSYCLQQEEQQLRGYWNYYAGKAHQLHEQGLTKHAVCQFGECIRISKLLVHSINDDPKQHSGIELLFVTSHNLAACYNVLREASKGEQVLRNLYAQVVTICEDAAYTRELRLDALSVLDKTLFSLCSQLAYMGKLSQLHQLLKQTAELVDQISLKPVKPDIRLMATAKNY